MTITILNGQAMAADQALIATSDRGLTLGDGLFETLLVRDGRIIDPDAHLDRLDRSLKLLGFPAPRGALDPRAALLMGCQVNGMMDGVLRLTVTRGSGPRGLAPSGTINPTVVVTAAPLPDRPPGFTAIIASVTRRNEHSPVSAIKALGYLDHILAVDEALKAGADDAILRNGAGHVACFSVANLIMRVGDRIVTPPVADGVLPGTMRQHLIRHLAITQQSLDPSDLATADEVIAVNSLGIRRLTAVDGQPLGGSDPLFQTALAIHRAL